MMTFDFIFIDSKYNLHWVTLIKTGYWRWRYSDAICMHDGSEMQDGEGTIMNATGPMDAATRAVELFILTNGYH